MSKYSNTKSTKFTPILTEQEYEIFNDDLKLVIEASKDD